MNFDVLFPDKRESGETPLRQCQLVMLRMLKIFDYLCQRHQIEYFLIGGTLLGAIRHKGFIPWDDDLDVGMTRANYEKFVRLAAPELPRDIFFQNSQTDPYYLPTLNVDARLRDKYSSYNHIGRPNNKWHEGLQVDIFVHDRAYLPSNHFSIALNKLLKKLNNDRKRASILKAIDKWVPLPLVYNSNFMQYFGEARAGTYITSRECTPLMRWPFEDMEALIPPGYHAYLTRQFRNYMQMPPEYSPIRSRPATIRKSFIGTKGKRLPKEMKWNPEQD